MFTFCSVRPGTLNLLNIQRPLFNRTGQFLMHFPLNQLFSLSVSLPLSYSLFPLAKRISFRSPTRLTTSHRNLLRLRTLICMLSFSFCSTLSLPIFRQFPSVLAIPARISLCSAYYAVLLCTCVARFGGIRNQKKKQEKMITITFIQTVQIHVQAAGLASSGILQTPRRLPCRSTLREYKPRNCL